MITVICTQETLYPRNMRYPGSTVDWLGRVLGQARWPRTLMTGKERGHLVPSMSQHLETLRSSWQVTYAMRHTSD